MYRSTIIFYFVNQRLYEKKVKYVSRTFYTFMQDQYVF